MCRRNVLRKQYLWPFWNWKIFEKFNWLDSKISKVTFPTIFQWWIANTVEIFRQITLFAIHQSTHFLRMTKCLQILSISEIDYQWVFFSINMPCHQKSYAPDQNLKILSFSNKVYFGSKSSVKLFTVTWLQFEYVDLT